MLLLFSMMTPHHHHQDGTPCCQPIEWEHSHGDESADTSHNGCEGHHLAVIDTQQANVHLEHYLIPLCVLFDYVYPPEVAFFNRLLKLIDVSSSESLYEVCLLRAIGLRGPPIA